MWPSLAVCSQASSYSVYFSSVGAQMEQSALLLPRCEGEVLEEAVSVKAV